MIPDEVLSHLAHNLRERNRTEAMENMSEEAALQVVHAAIVDPLLRLYLEGAHWRQRCLEFMAVNRILLSSPQVTHRFLGSNSLPLPFTLLLFPLSPGGCLT